MHIVELYAALKRAQGRESELMMRVRSYSASAGCQKDVQSLKRIGLDTSQISDALQISPGIVEGHMARTEEEEMRRRMFLLTGNTVEPKWRGGSFHILQR